jgi:Zn-dependent protease with chaperone function
VSLSFLAPLLAASVAAAVAGLLQRWLRPQVTSQCLAVATVAVAAAYFWALAAMVLGALVEVSALDGWASWCASLFRADADDHVNLWVGLASGALMTASALRVARTALEHRRLRRRMPRCDDGVLILPSDEPTAYAVPGRGGGVVVSTGMMNALDAHEQNVLWAHERSHLAHQHHRYLLAAELSAAAVPLLRPLADQVRFATERWADEDAAAEVGGDRGLVARAIARAAIASVDHRRTALALAETGVGARVRALVEVDRWFLTPLAGTAVGVAVIAFTLGGSGVQLHHLVTFILRLCRGG